MVPPEIREYPAFPVDRGQVDLMGNKEIRDQMVLPVLPVLMAHRDQADPMAQLVLLGLPVLPVLMAHRDQAADLRGQTDLPVPQVQLDQAAELVIRAAPAQLDRLAQMVLPDLRDQTDLPDLPDPKTLWFRPQKASMLLR
jgi:hypothetical protein